MNQAVTVPRASAVDIVLERLDGVQNSGKGWRARCPACGGADRKVSVAEGDDGRVLLNCFGRCKVVDVLAAVGLTWAAIMPPREWPESPEERRKARRAIREAGWASALCILAREATIVLLAGRQLASGQALAADDQDRLHLAIERIDGAREVLA